MKENGLCVAVVLHGLVKIQVVLGQIRKDPHVVSDTVDPALVQRVGRGLHHHMGAARIQHPAKQLMQLKALRRGPLRGQDLRADHVLVGADQTHLRPCRLLQNSLQQIRGGGLAVGAGDGGHDHMLRRMTEPVGAQHSQRPPGLLHQHVGNAGLRLPLTHGAYCPGLLRLSDIGMTVHGIATDGDEHVALMSLTGVITDAGDFKIFIRVKLQYLCTDQ
ncbi:hypothetical protein SDC9_79740 [bioreactor metagenome]|uniref:Uncharacterized protein n=1 Tax=bioreactor metagenome TaxID=1076179 RepID=A0A644YZB5_9ZZZZ